MPKSDSLFLPTMILLALFATWMFVYSAWISDDALISLRQVVMFGDGHGMVWNLGQRVQAFSHTSWFLLLSLGYVLTGSLFYMTLVISGLCVAGALLLYWRQCQALLSGWTMVVLMALPLTSAAFRDYMSSGLENPLSFLLVGGIVTLAWKTRSHRQDQSLWMLFALAVLTRQDHALHFGPLALWVLYKNGFWQQVKASLPVVGILIGWFVFATFYFGAPLPNTYYAKLTAGVPDADVAQLARFYFYHTLDLRMGTALVVILGMVCAILASPVSRALGVGIALHLIYLKSIGGDFMVGRFLTVDFLMACFILVDVARRLPSPRALGLSTCLALGVLAMERPFVIDTDLENLAFTRVIDERLMFASVYGLMSPTREWPEIRKIDPSVRPAYIYAGCGFIGAARFNWPDSIHLIDLCGLTDPYLARLPIYHEQLKKAGHLGRGLPLAYTELVLNRPLPEGGIGGSRTVLEQTWDITHAPLTAPGRLSNIIELNTSNRTLDRPYWTHPDKSERALILGPAWIGPRPEGYPDFIRPSKAHDDYFDRLFPPKPIADPSAVAPQSPE